MTLVSAFGALHFTLGKCDQGRWLLRERLDATAHRGRHVHNGKSPRQGDISVKERQHRRLGRRKWTAKRVEVPSFQKRSLLKSIQHRHSYAATRRVKTPFQNDVAAKQSV